MVLQFHDQLIDMERHRLAAVPLHGRLNLSGICQSTFWRCDDPQTLTHPFVALSNVRNLTGEYLQRGFERKVPGSTVYRCSTFCFPVAGKASRG